jgi:hypothetical protein
VASKATTKKIGFAFSLEEFRALENSNLGEKAMVMSKTFLVDIRQTHMEIKGGLLNVDLDSLEFSIRILENLGIE